MYAKGYDAHGRTILLYNRSLCDLCGSNVIYIRIEALLDVLIARLFFVLAASRRLKKLIWRDWSVQLGQAAFCQLYYRHGTVMPALIYEGPVPHQG